MNKTWIRTIIAFAIAPLVVPIAYFIYDGTAGGFNTDRFIGSLLTYGVYAYILALVLGAPTLVLLIRTGRRQLWHFALAAGAIGLLGSGLMTLLGLRPSGLFIGAVAGVIAGAVFHFMGGYRRPSSTTTR